MIYKNFKGKKISKITLGTAQLGMKYGVANKIGMPSLESSNQILKFAINCGINSFDTAQNYGNSEKILGDFLNNNQILDSQFITTKISEVVNDDEKNIYDKMKNLIANSEKVFGKIRPFSYLLHEPGIINEDNLQIKNLKKIRNEGIVDLIGISVYNPNEVKDFLNIEGLDVIQIPINVFDSRLIEANLLEELCQNNILVFGRSIYLQGLLYLNLSDIPDYLSQAKKFLIELNEIASANKMNSRELAFQYVNNIENISSLVIGVESSDQLKENIDFLKLPKISDNLREEIMLKFRNIPKEVINPTLWK